MSGGRTAILGFDYQAVVTLDTLLDWFARDASIRVRPEGEDDFTVESLSPTGAIRHHFQVKKPREVAGENTGAAWTLTELASELLPATLVRLGGNQDRQTWVLGDPVDDAFHVVLAAGHDDSLRSSQPFLRVVHTVARHGTTWESPHGNPTRSLGQWRSQSDLPGDLETLIEEFCAFARQRGAVADAIKSYEDKARAVASRLPTVLARLQVRSSAGTEEELEIRVKQSLGRLYGLPEQVVGNTLYRNLRGFINDIAKQPDRWLDHEEFEYEVRSVWPNMNLVVLPEPLEDSILPREGMINELLARADALALEIVGASGSGKTTVARALFAALSRAETSLPPFFVALDENSTLRHVLVGVSFHLRRYKIGSLFGRLAPHDLSDETVFSRFAEGANASDEPITILVDIESGAVQDHFVRDLARLLPFLQPGPVRLLFFAQESVLRNLTALERMVLGVPDAFEVPGFSFEELIAVRQRAGATVERQLMWRVYEHFTRGRASGLEAYFAASLATLKDEDLLKLLNFDPSDGLKATTRTRFDRLPDALRGASEHLVCFALPFSRVEAEAAFPREPVGASIEALRELGLLRRYDATRFEMHEMIRSGFERLIPQEMRFEAHKALARLYRGEGQLPAEVHHLVEAGLWDEAFTVTRSGMVAGRFRNALRGFALRHGLLGLEDLLRWLQADPFDGDLYWLPEAIAQRSTPETANQLLEHIRTHLEQFDRDWGWAAIISETVLRCDPSRLTELIQLGLDQPNLEGAEFDRLQRIVQGARRCGARAGDAEMAMFDQAQPRDRWWLLPVLTLGQTREGWHRALAWTAENDRPNASESRARAWRLDTYDLRPSEDSVGEVLDALPCPEVSQLLFTVGLGFGRLTAWAWQHRRILGFGAERILRQGSSSRQQLNALRVFAFLGDPRTLEMSLSFLDRQDELGTFACLLPALMPALADREYHRRRLFDRALPLDRRAAEFQTLTTLGESPAALLQATCAAEPDLVALWEFWALLSATKRPFPEAVGLLERHLFNTQPDQPPKFLEALLLSLVSSFPGQAGHLLERCLHEGDERLRTHAYMACWYARSRDLLETIIECGGQEINPVIATVAAWAALASGPGSLRAIEPVLFRSLVPNPLRALAVGRTLDATAAAEVVRIALDAGESWFVRRAAIFAAANLPHEVALQHLLPLLGQPFPLDRDDSPSLHGHATLTHLLKFFGLELFSFWKRGRMEFLNFMTPLIQTGLEGLALGFPPQPPQPLAEWLFDRLGYYQAIDASDESRLRSLSNDLYAPALHAAVLSGLRRQAQWQELDGLIPLARNDWQLILVVCERFKDAPPDAARLAQLRALAAGPPFKNEIALRNVLNWLASTRTPPPAPAVSGVSVIELDHQGVMGILEREALPGDAPCVIRGLTQSEFLNLVWILRPQEDSVQTAPRATSLAVNGRDFSLTQSSSSRSTPERRNTRSKLRGALMAANRFNLYVPWYAWELEHDRDFLKGFVESVGAQGDADALFEVLNRDGFDLFSRLEAWHLHAPLHRLIDQRIVPWLLRFAHAGNDDFLETLCAFAGCVRGEAVDAALGMLWARVTGRLTDQSRPDKHLAWRALRVLVEHPRIWTIPNRSLDLQRILRTEGTGYYRETVVDYLNNDPASYVLVEQELLESFDFARPDRVTNMDDAAAALFNKAR